ncbi:hypothetical protein [Bacteroides sp. An19]|uniref:hypothetical protein n=1 Tax=Bacteroides sp. An19 TaxID=1965580 RepID=UPI0013A629CF|nr:hypothetical protein [Bacteroides sp. An19]
MEKRRIAGQTEKGTCPLSGKRQAAWLKTDMSPFARDAGTSPPFTAAWLAAQSVLPE